MTEKVRAFLSVDIDDDSLLDRITRIQSHLDVRSARVKMVERENIHFTLRFLGDTSLKKIEEIRDKLSSINLPPFEIEVSGVGAFPRITRPSVIWVGVTKNGEKMIELKKRVDEGLREVGYSQDRKFTPHATIARVKSVQNRRPLIETIENLSDEEIGLITVESYCMTKSTLTPRGAVYETVWKLPLIENGG